MVFVELVGSGGVSASPVGLDAAPAQRTESTSSGERELHRDSSSGKRSGSGEPQDIREHGRSLGSGGGSGNHNNVPKADAWREKNRLAQKAFRQRQKVQSQILKNITFLSVTCAACLRITSGISLAHATLPADWCMCVLKALGC